MPPGGWLRRLLCESGDHPRHVAQPIAASAAFRQVPIHLRSLKDRKIAKHVHSKKPRVDGLGLLLGHAYHPPSYVFDYAYLSTTNPNANTK
jgi:hypothetical protein